MPTELGLNSLYKVLKDETRKKVILALHDKGSLTYSELMASVQVESTGKFSYRLKILNGLIIKGDDGKYALSEKGESAYRLLSDFPEAKGLTKENVKKISTVVGLGHAVFLISIVLLYVFGYVDFSRLVLGIVAGTFSLAITYFTFRNYESIHSGTKAEYGAVRFVYTVGGGCIAGFLAFGCDIIINQTANILKTPSPMKGSWGSSIMALTFIVAPVIGGIIGYVYGEKTGFKWAKAPTY
jgi:hypothetical protein